MPERFHDMDKSRAPRALDYAMVLCAVTIWGGSFAATKYALAQAEPSLILCLRLAMTLPVLAAGCALGRELRLPTAHEAFVLALLGFQGICFHQGIQAVAMKTAGAGNANWMMVASPAVVAVLGDVFRGREVEAEVGEHHEVLHQRVAERHQSPSLHAQHAEQEREGDERQHVVHPLQEGERYEVDRHRVSHLACE